MENETFQICKSQAIPDIAEIMTKKLHQIGPNN